VRVYAEIILCIALAIVCRWCRDFVIAVVVFMMCIYYSKIRNRIYEVFIFPETLTARSVVTRGSE
jgi:hypothetical protein